MRLETWLPMYDQICEEFSFDKAKDLESARWLSARLGGNSVKTMAEIRKAFPDSVLVCGGGPNLADEVSSLTIEGFVFAADSATTTLIEAGVKVDAIASDLDGIVEDQIELNRQGTPIFIHAHGDNMPALKKYVGKFQGRVVGTCQCPPPEGMFNFGGFTDGDRAVCIASELGAKDIFLAGFDFDNPSEKTGKSKAVKLRKLAWAKRVLDAVSKEGVRLRPASDAVGGL